MKKDLKKIIADNFKKHGIYVEENGIRKEILETEKDFNHVSLAKEHFIEFKCSEHDHKTENTESQKGRK